MNSAISMGLNKNDIKAFLKDLELIALPEKKKREILKRTLQAIRKQAISAASHQQSPTGQPWEKRKKGTAKMLRRIAKLANSKAEDKQGRLFYKNRKSGLIAKEHQEGLDHLFKKTDFRGKNKGGSATDPATPRQARKLRELGYTVGGTKRNKRRRKPGIREIINTLTRERASLIIRKLEEKYGKSASRNLREWIIPTEKRAFLETRDEKNAELLLAEIKKYYQ
ncbi:hypothetical protein ACE4RU_10645 [Actinobacillus seminis]|uniref:hypothetical protein n=1 Tax=Actinobacillus seminis TaxID=722 RepID=UPI003B94C544